MSEHIKITGKVDFMHLPYREKDGFTACKRCLKKGKFANKLTIEFHEGWLHDWMRVICANCKKTIYVVSFRQDPRKDMFVPIKEHKRLKKLKGEKLEVEMEGVRFFVTDDKKCEICKKPTNHYDCWCVSSCLKYKRGKTVYLCSEKCNNKLDKRVFK